MMCKRIFGFGLLGCLLAPAAPAGVMWGEGVDKKIVMGSPGRSSIRYSGRIKAAHWIAHNGRVAVQRFPTPLDLSVVDGLVAPRGQWVDLVLDLDGPLVLSGTSSSGASVMASLDIPQWTIALDEPVSSSGGTEVSLNLVLPTWLADEMAGAPGQVLVVDAHHPLYRALVQAVQDGAYAR